MNETLEMEIYLHEQAGCGDSRLCAFNMDMSNLPDYLYLTSKSVTFELPPERERTERKIAALRKKLAERQAADHKAQAEIADAIQRLLCIEAPK